MPRSMLHLQLHRKDQRSKLILKQLHKAILYKN
uniref:Uncharacterized protein n=1 Tax=Siphoviridae sp. ct5op20 TaxID=2826295 RepID=A0A8S5NS59_9CAUD|nr:MAG TPA: hypothetical protein [Siphoviridae sp. ct5op20]